jgi:hypothetical protein
VFETEHHVLAISLSGVDPYACPLSRTVTINTPVVNRTLKKALFFNYLREF